MGETPPSVLRTCPVITMKPFFKNPERVRQLEAESRRWVGTPFVPFQGVCQGGCDCVHLVHQLATVCGFPHELKPPRYTLDATAHREDSQLREYLESIPDCFRLDDGTRLMPGDLVTFIMGRAPHHLGMLVTPPVFIHSIRGLGATFSQLNDPTYARRQDAVYRLMES